MPNGAAQHNRTAQKRAAQQGHPSSPTPIPHTHTTRTHNKQAGRQESHPKTGLGPGLIYGHQSGEQRAAISKKILNGVHTANGGRRRGETVH